MTVQASCPSCGAPVTFTVASSLVTVCSYCRSVVARGDRTLESLGKVADLVQTGTLLAVGRQGRFQGVPFTLVGRRQLAHGAGGVWDEWYAAFADGRWGWLAEAQGRFYLTFEQPSAGSLALPSYKKLRLGQALPVVPGGVPLTVAEKGRARALSAEGEMPYRLEPGQEYCYADLSGPQAEFATLDYVTDTPVVFLGRELTLDELGMPDLRPPPGQEAPRVAAVTLNCPQCGGALTLRAPDRTERVACPNCGALLDASQGKLSLFKALRQDRIQPRLPLGATGKWDGPEFTVIGFFRRSVKIEGVRYSWDEYLLYEPHHGFRWLVCSDGHWSFVEPLPPGAVRTPTPRTAFYGDKEFHLFQRAEARVDYVLGECYWKVTVGETVDTADYVRPPQMLSREASSEDEAGEINWSLGTYATPAAVAQAFGVKDLPAPTGVAPNQPFLYGGVYRSWAVLLGVALLLGLVFLVIDPRHTVLEERVPLRPDASGAPLFVSDNFALQGRENVRVTVEAPLDNSWLHVDGDLVNERKGPAETFALLLEHYHGVEEGEAWNEGSDQARTYLSSVPAGQYALRLKWQTANQNAPAAMTVRLEQGVPRFAHWCLLQLALLVIPVGVAIFQILFERNRWQDSPYSTFGSGS